MKQPETDQDRNLTGQAVAPDRAARMVEATREFPPNAEGSALDIAAVRVQYVQELPDGPVSAGPDAFVLLKEIIGNLKTASDNAMALVRRTVSLMSQRRDELMTSPALRALELAIWSDKKRIPPQEIERLRLLWGEYFENTSDSDIETSHESSP